MGEGPHQLDLWAWSEAQPPCLVPLDLGSPSAPSPDLVLLHRVDAEANMRRFYRLSVARGLFGEWGVVRQWGRIGGTGRSLTEWHAAPEAARTALEKTAGKKRRRGYR